MPLPGGTAERGCAAARPAARPSVPRTVDPACARPGHGSAEPRTRAVVAAPAAHAQPRVSPISLRPLLAAAEVGRVSRLGQMRLDSGAHQFFDHEPPAGAAL